MGSVSDQPKAPLTTTTSIWPAAAVLIVAVAMLAIFMVMNLVADQTVTTTTTTPPVVVGGLDVAASNVALDYCRHTSEIPSNIVDAFLVPVGTQPESGANIPNAGAGEFDCYQPLVTPAGTSALLSFYTTHLESLGWHLFSRGASNGAPQSLFQKAGNDSFYWVVGITVTRSSPKLAHWTFRIYQNSQTI
jgi:hypothetical protein